ncbi:MFS transporter, DHA1 family, bicyclomycin/chloramphenicol resistance protein [Paenibacillus sp. UNCCL117]|uniref:multidrug effflux MFS transporter n=1 Tax=unclassified Paenibacillus TaxID=185978 RepID=UPI0008908128|nr:MULTISPECIES: multidrug effflux MFS transporter [unclassified Paenibacillus]SDD56623.1 MFS transporter, DHA1 family, bicyclomycin/chloramphenicol resistance protein [Paenibacillus sp. cl123]SFW51350.1 MFS transporter, DHA1 family, bicyclomycin/chloramphenicol resistance protein [Paenibacillus sp. UNCCL117]
MNSETLVKSGSAGRSRVRFALLLGAFSALGPFTIDMYLPSFPEIAAEFGTQASLVQLSLTACLLGLAVGQLVMGTLSDVMGRRKPLLLAMILYAAASLICAIAPSIGFFIAVRFIQGFAAAAGIVISRAIVRDVYSGHELTKFFSLLMLVGNLGPLLAPVAGSGVIAVTAWNGVFLFLGLAGLLLVMATVWKLDETLPEEKRVSSNLLELIGNFKSLMKDRQFAGYALAQGIMIAGVFAYVSGTPFIYQKIYGASPQLFAFLFGSNGISLIIGSQVVGRLAHRISERRFLVIGLLLSVAASFTVLLVVLFQGPLFALVIPLFFFVASIGMTATASFSLAMETQSRLAGSAAALLGLIPFLLGAVTSPLVGIAGEDTAVPLGIIILATSVLALLSYLGLARGPVGKTGRASAESQG